jgi:uncharacterized protein with HEPN domain
LWFTGSYLWVSALWIVATGVNQPPRFLNDQKTIDAVTRNLEIVGEAAFQMDEVIKNRFPDIPWHRIVGLRHRIVHDYFGVDTSLIWGIATKDVEELANILRKHSSC